MSDGLPQVTIIVATYNREKFIVESLESIINQTYKQWECLIIDDGGTDNTEQVISGILKKDNRFQFFKRPNAYKKGISGCRNYGIDKAKGDYLIFFDDDDIVHPQNLELCLKAFQLEEIDFCVYEKEAFFRTIQEINFQKEHIGSYSLISKDDIGAIIKYKISIASCTVLWKRKCFFNERFNENLLYAEEWECYPRIIGNGKKGLKINNVLYFNRKHPNSNTGEFYTNNKKRVNSKKMAIGLLAKNLLIRNLLSSSMRNYLLGLAISFRDKKLLKEILVTSGAELKVGVFSYFKFHMFPVWKMYQKILKKKL